MVKPFLLPILLCVCCYVSVSQANQVSAQAVIGEAYDIKSKRLVYTEEHHFMEGDEHSVIYREPDGTVFAKKKIDYSRGVFTPSIKQHNQRMGEVIEINLSAAGYLQAQYQKSEHSQVEKALVSLSDIEVIDAGFNRFVKHHWDALQAGEIVFFEYFVPSRLKAITLQAESLPCAEKTSVCIEIKPKKWLFSLLLKPILLQYSGQNKALEIFEGRSNIADSSGEYHRVKIEYRPVGEVQASSTYSAINGS